MGPRSDNRGYVHRTGRMLYEPYTASMGPRSDNRGYGQPVRTRDLSFPRTSMGPRSDNRGYERFEFLKSSSAAGV